MEYRAVRQESDQLWNAFFAGFFQEGKTSVPSSPYLPLLILSDILPTHLGFRFCFPAPFRITETDLIPDTIRTIANSVVQELFTLKANLAPISCFNKISRKILRMELMREDRFNGFGFDGFGFDAPGSDSCAGSTFELIFVETR